MSNAQEINERFGIEDSLEFVEHPSGLVQGLVTTSQCKGSFFLLGAHVAEFEPRAAEPILFLSEKTNYAEGKAIRGGVPLCFPWFGPRKDAEGNFVKDAPSHGLVRTEVWDVLSVNAEADRLSIVLGIQLEEMAVRFTLSFAAQLEMGFEVENQSKEPIEYEVALHTYFVVQQVSEVAITGLEKVAFLDQLTGETVSATGEPIRFTEETDRIYHGNVDKISLQDPLMARTIQVIPKNSGSTVVWNPWVNKSKRMEDFGDEEYPSMCCIETAAIRPNHVLLQPGDKETLGVKIAVEES